MGKQTPNHEVAMEQRIIRLEKRVDALERRLAQGNPLGGASMIVMDKEHDRVMHAMGVIEDTYSAHQNWRVEDKKRYRELKARRNELRKALNVQQ